MRQDDHAAADRRLRAAHRRADPPRRPRPRRHPAASPAGQHRLPVLRPVPPPERGGQRRLRPALAARRRQGRPGAAGARGDRAGPPRRTRTPAAGAALRRSAAARRPRPGPRAGAVGPAPRRAPRRPRRQAAQVPPGRSRRPPARGRDHLRLRHPRPGGGVDDVRPARGDGRRQRRPGRHAHRGLRAAGDCLRRRLPRCRQPHRRHRRARLAAAAGGCTSASSPSTPPARATPAR